MKTIRTFTSALAIAATLALWASSAKAVTVVGTTTAYSTINITLTVITNGADTTKNGVTTYHTGKVKATNKTLLGIFAGWSTNDTSGWQAAGARLEFDWVADQVIVADKTGTNVLFYADDGVNAGTITAYFDIEWYYDEGPYTGKDNENTPGSYSYQEANTSYFEFYFQDTSDTSTQYDIYSYSPDMMNYSETFNVAKPKWTESESFKINYCDITYKNQDESQVTGSITTSGHGAGSNPYLD